MIKDIDLTINEFIKITGIKKDDLLKNFGSQKFFSITDWKIILRYSIINNLVEITKDHDFNIIEGFYNKYAKKIRRLSK